MPTAVELQDVHPGVVQVTMQDREGSNSFTPRLVSGLIDAFRTIAASPEIRAVILTGYGNYFCSGGTREMLTAMHEGRARFSDTDVYRLALGCEIPVIAAMQGHGVGGGFVFGLFADFVVLSRESVYTANFMRYGFTPGMGATYVLPEKLGTALATDMLVSARSFRGEELARRGVPFPVLPRPDVLPHALGLAEEVAHKPRVALVTLKAHLVREARRRLPEVIEHELAMHRQTFHRPEVAERIERLYGQ